LVNLFFTQAIQTSVSDIHIECFEHELRIRFRKDGTLKVFMTSNKAAHPAVVSRIKVMANLDIAETRMPQDGRIKLSLVGRKVDVRVSTIPCVWGEKICMRLCDQGNLKVNLTELGFEPFVLDRFMDGIKNPNGIILVTGPTGSGKTTTLYSALYLLNNPGINIMTAEDPVEYNLMGVNQVQCHPDIGLDFSAALRSFLRQDPDTIMIGEIRDFETASIAIKAALTGHLVISTLHTNDAPATIARLLNMGVEPFAVTTSVRVVQAQRLVKRICKSCLTEYQAPPDLVKSLGLDAKMLHRLRLDDKIDLNNIVLAKGAGCQDCDGTGYKGRQGIYEVLTMTEGFRSLILGGGGPEDMRRQAMRDGMLSLRQSALYKLLSKITTTEQVIETTMEGGSDVDEADALAAIQVAAEQAAAAEQGTNPGIHDLTREISSFRSAMEKFGSGASMPVIHGEIFRQNLTDPLAQIQQQVKSGMAGAEFGKVLPAIHAQGQKMDFNLRNLAAHFSLPDLKPVGCHLNELAEKLMLAPLKDFVMLARLLSGVGSIGTNLKVTKNLQNGLPPIVFDVESFRLIAVNLLVNALMALPKGGEIKLVSRPKPGEPAKVELAILDGGMGIPAEKHQGLFAPFVPLGRKTLGLGLSVVKKLMTAGGGSVSLKSSPGNTLIVLEFPVKSS
jgi:type II secretory ATPase GspE/PulE/Tfp pilus assembly ATPase PilB-like protein